MVLCLAIRISVIESHTFTGLRSLRSLDLSGNQLATIHPEALSVPSRALRDLNLSRSLYNHTSVICIIHLFIIPVATRC